MQTGSFDKKEPVADTLRVGFSPPDAEKLLRRSAGLSGT